MITYAQEITVTGKVTAGGEEMPGVTVAVKGQTRGTITSIDGSYQIQRPFVMVTNGGELSEAAQAFLDFATSADAKDLISSAGAVPAAK